MKKSGFLFILLLTVKLVSAQNDTTHLYIQFPDIPPFTISKLPDSSSFAKADLQKRKPTLMILFSPDCEHCQHETKELLANIELFKKYQIVMVANLNFDLIKKFYEEYHIADYPNITMGRDGKYFLGTFYKLHTYPSIFLYNKKGKFVKHFEGSVPVTKIAEAL